MERPKEQEILKNCYLTKVNTKSVILSKKVVGEVISESAKLGHEIMIYTKSYSQQMFLVTVMTYEDLFQYFLILLSKILQTVLLDLCYLLKDFIKHMLKMKPSQIIHS